jgi:hypothetical protein
MRRSLFTIAALLFAPLAFAQVYKWTDAAGTVHYSETPPSTGTRYQQMNLAGGAAALSQPAASASVEAPPQAAPATTPSAPTADTPANRTALCNTLKTNLAALNGSGPVVMQDAGGQKVLDDKQRQAQIAAANQQYQQYCTQ